jgi:hypothetical protein
MHFRVHPGPGDISFLSDLFLAGPYGTNKSIKMPLNQKDTCAII